MFGIAITEFLPGVWNLSSRCGKPDWWRSHRIWRSLEEEDA